MAIITRLTRLFRADVHAVLDRMEEPVVLLRQAVREMEDEVSRNTRQLKACELERQQLQGRLQTLDAARSELAGQLDLCFAARNETLARTLLRRRLESERMQRQLELRIANLQRGMIERGAQLDEQRQRLEATRQKAELFDDASTQAQHTGERDWHCDVGTVSDADVELAWLREQQQRGTA
jgi:phage shock protein A